MKTIVCGVGINDAAYPVTQYVKENGNYKIVWQCPFYLTWKNLIARCYSKKWLTKYPAYRGCNVCDEWLTFSNFKSWMETQNWQDKALDKDLLVQGNKIYSPDTCVFIDQKINNFTTDRANARGKYLLGVHWYKKTSKFKAQCQNPFKGKNEHIGYFDNELDAHLAWRAKKHEHACKLADLCDDERLAKALRTRYLIDG